MAEIDKEHQNENENIKIQDNDESKNEQEKDQTKDTEVDPVKKGKEEKSNQICLSNFILQNQIGMGSFGKVFKIKDKNTKKIYAAKISIQEISEITNETIMNIISEVNIISKLHHPSILQYIGYSPINFKNKRKPVIITEYASNGTLLDLIELDRSSKANNKWDFTQKIICIYGIASAMSYLHAHDIIHRDLKPENILIDSFLFPKIADFGLSKIKQAQTDSLNQSTKTIKGTPIYISPEIWGKCEYSKAGDVYAFGIILYEIITKERPFSDVNIFQILKMIKSGYRPQFKNHVPPSYRQLIEMCWSEDPKSRPSFSQITEKLKHDKRFITESVDEEKFQKYVKFIDESKVSFDSSKNSINKDDIYKFFKEVNRNNESDNKTIQIIRQYSNTIKHCPLNFYLSLNDECKKKIDEFEKDLKYFEIAEWLIEGQHPFERNIPVGMKYLKISVKSGNIKASVYYFKNLIKGKIIPQNLKKARKILHNINNKDKSLYYYMEGKLHTKEYNYEKALESFDKSIKLRNVESLYEYGKLLVEGKGTSMNEIDGLKYIEESAEKGSVRGMYKYGELLIEGKMIQKNEAKGREYIKKAAELGDPKSLYYYSTLIKEDDKEKINEYLKESAYKGYIKAMHQYALKLPAKPEYREENILFFKKAGEKGHIDSLYQYASFLQNNNDEESKKKVAKYYRIAAFNGSLKAMNGYANCLFKGYGIECDKEEAVKYLKLSADKGDENAMYSYGYCLLNGEGVDPDAKESEKYLKMSIERGYEKSMHLYAQMLYEGIGITENKEESAKYFKMSADKGNTKAMVDYALLLLKGEGVEYNKEEGFEYLNKAIEKGYNYAYHIYGLIYYEGTGVEVDKKEAHKYFKIAVDKGVIESMSGYALMLYKGDGIQQNKEEAFNYLKKAADNGNIHAMTKYANSILILNESDIDLDEAMKYYKMSADDENSEGMSIYGFLLLFENNIEIQKKIILGMREKFNNDNDEKVISVINEVFKDEKIEINPDGLEYLEKAAKCGYIPTMRLLGLWYLRKQSIKNDAKAAKYFKMSADNGDADSMRDYGLMCYYGQGIPENINECLKYLQMGVRKRDSQSAYNLASIFYNGEKIPKDIQTAIQYFKIASDLGYLDATISLAHIFFDTNKEESFKYFKIAADKGHVASNYNSGYMLESGLITPVNKNEAFKYYKVAASKGHIEAINRYIAFLYSNSNEVEVDETDKEDLVKYLDNVDVHKDGTPMRRMGEMHYCGELVPVNKEEAMKYFKIAIEKGNSTAMTNLAYMFENGDGIPVDFEEAIKYYKMAMDKGDPVAFNNYAYMLENGEGVPVNKEEAVKYYKIGADKGSAASMFHYAKMLHYGEGIECNKIEAIKYYKMAIENGVKKGKEDLEKLLDEFGFENEKVVESEN